ncbi:MAG TPA: hypothetical protein VGG98_00975 [Solirubrobacteraceae bacterium]|jgi:hypothetical protein
MHTESRESRAEDGSRLERTIVLQLLREDHDRRWSRAELGAVVEADARAMEAALGRLTEEGVLCLAEDVVWASHAARRLDGLGLICV